MGIYECGCTLRFLLIGSNVVPVPTQEVRLTVYAVRKKLSTEGFFLCLPLHVYLQKQNIGKRLVNR